MPSEASQTTSWISRMPSYTGLVLAGLTLLLSLLHFDPKVSIGGDDSAYIYRTLLFLKKGQFPSFQGPLYPLVLTPFVALFGLRLWILKLLSVVFTVGTTWFTWLTLRLHKTQRTAWLGALFLFVTNYSILTFASLTYSEAFYMFLQAVLLWLIARFSSFAGHAGLGQEIRKILPLAGLGILMFLARSIGVAALVSLGLWFLLRKEFIRLGLLVGLSIVLYLPFHAFKTLVFKDPGAQFSEQGKGLLLKDPYKPELGQEDAAGFVNRFLENSVLYFSKRMPQMLGFLPVASTKKFPLLAVLVWLVILGSTPVHFKRGDALASFTGLYVTVFCALTFIVLQTRWDQERLIMVVVPYVLFLFFSLAALAEVKRFSWLKPVLAGAWAVIFIANTGRTLSNVSSHITLLRKSLSGNPLYGFTPDLINFIRMSQYAAKTLPPDAKIVSRKPTISSIYAGGREFEGMYVPPPADPDSSLNWFRRRGAEYVIDARLRQNPSKYTGQYITTITYALYYIQTKYPERIHLLHQIGQSEEAYLYKLDLN